MRKSLSILVTTVCFGAAGCQTAKKVGDGATWTYQKTKSGMVGAGRLVTTGFWGAGRMMGDGAKKLWPWKKKTAGPTEETKAVASAAKPVAPKPVTKSAAATASPPRVSYAKSNLWVTDAALGTDHRHFYENTSIKLSEGWEISGTKLNYVAEYADSPPKMLRVEGSPAIAKTMSDGHAIVVEASEIHYRQDTGLLALKGFPKARIGLKRISATSAQTVLILNLNDGSFQVEGPIKSSSD